MANQIKIRGWICCLLMIFSSVFLVESVGDHKVIDALQFGGDADSLVSASAIAIVSSTGVITVAGEERSPPNLEGVGQVFSSSLSIFSKTQAKTPATFSKFPRVDMKGFVNDLVVDEMADGAVYMTVVEACKS
eukprot:gene5569-6131_t